MVLRTAQFMPNYIKQIEKDCDISKLNAILPAVKGEDLSLDFFDIVEVLGDSFTQNAINAQEKALRAVSVLYNWGYTPAVIGSDAFWQLGKAHIGSDTDKRAAKCLRANLPTTYVLTDALTSDALRQGIICRATYFAKYGRFSLVFSSSNESAIGKNITEKGNQKIELKALAVGMGEGSRINWYIDGKLCYVDHVSEAIRSFDCTNIHWIRVDVRAKNGELIASHSPLIVNMRSKKQAIWKDLSDAILKPKIKAVLLDKDGTLIEFTESCMAVTIDFVNTLGLTADEQAAALLAIGIENNTVKDNSVISSGTISDTCTALSEFTNFAVKPDMLEQHYYAYIKAHPEDIKPRGDIKKLVTALAERNIKLAVVTADNTKLAQLTVDILGISDSVLYIAGGDVFPGKPSPESIIATCEHLDITPNQALFVGDSNRDIMLGLICGKVLGIESSVSDLAKLRHLSDAMITKLDDILDYL